MKDVNDALLQPISPGAIAKLWTPMKYISSAAIVGRLGLNCFTQIKHSFVVWQWLVPLYVNLTANRAGQTPFVVLAGSSQSSDVPVIALFELVFFIPYFIIFAGAVIFRGRSGHMMSRNARALSGWSILKLLQFLTLDFGLQFYASVKAGRFRLGPLNSAQIPDYVWFPFYAFMMLCYLPFAVFAFRSKLDTMHDAGFFAMCAFANQLLSVVEVAQIKLIQTEVVLFGGEDAEIQPGEEVAFRNFERAVAPAIRGSDLPKWKQFLIQLTWDAADFQKVYYNSQ